MRWFMLALCLLLTRTAAAGVPAKMPVQGYLTDTNGAAVNGNVSIQFQLYATATGGTAVYSETQAVAVVDGTLTVYLGANVPLDLNLFRNGAAYLGVTLQGEAEMTPRLELGTVPYAAYAQETASVPPGAVMMFDLDTCPAGWSALDAARGRAIVGVPTGGMRGGTVGSPLGDKEDRLHTHVVDPVSTLSTSSGTHTHDVNIPSITTSPSGAHNHAWSVWNNAAKIWLSHNSAGSQLTVMDWTTRGGEIGMDTVGGGNHPFAIDDTQPLLSQSFYTTNVAAHTHTVDAPSVVSTSNGTHAHATDIAATTSTATSATMPYLQLLICRKD
jgi:hypothetical protein